MFIQQMITSLQTCWLRFLRKSEWGGNLQACSHRKNPKIRKNAPSYTIYKTMPWTRSNKIDIQNLLGFGKEGQNMGKQFKFCLFENG